MATTNDVTLRLKAQLDTTQVKQQLNELRKYQGNSNKGVSSDSPVNNGNVLTGGNLAVNINNAIVRLNKILTQLNQSISRLATTNNLGLTKTQLVNGGSREFASPISINEEYIKRLSNSSNGSRKRVYIKSNCILPDLTGDEKKK